MTSDDVEAAIAAMNCQIHDEWRRYVSELPHGRL
jgi:hypothetical protein